ncbi:5-HT4 receptor [Elysia marginata]|uniref:5-HT4 receptor n=1 Tax=Elysia marginata TaxID=1093978 RepID=A0AAV4HKR7_9GAST|nr:5-HT4 receptor [Elysia marginata]
MDRLGFQLDALTSASSQSNLRAAYNGVDVTSSSTAHVLASSGNFSTKPTQPGNGYDISPHGNGGGGAAGDGPDCDLVLSHVAGPPPSYSDPVRIIISIVLICVPILTVFGNTVVILAVITHKRLRTITNAFVVSLAVADMCVALFVMPFSIYQQINNKQWFLGEVLCKLSSSLDVMMCTVSIFHLSCLAVDRYLAICRPFLHERLTVKLISIMLVLCWITPIFISFIPILNGWNHKGIEHIVACAFPIEADICVFVVNLPFAIICSLIAFYIPVVFMGVCNAKIYMAAIKQAHQIRTLEAAGSHNHYR